ncbi:subtilisin-like protease SBT5.6 [Macadamia integrifolia]|uniref:subtilisin-like protease SBT5.6 n=1 Tax=Macadamia integrifolia TaxID=60698 RepID=UPI001C4F56EA|nr:subtilisin-like protease SBT5.6 [Macadamia integrifolia]
MRNLTLSSLFLLLLPLAACEHQVFIVNLGEHGGDKTSKEIEDTHHSFLASVKKTEEVARASLLYSYKNTINGFAALLTPEEADTFSRMDKVVSVLPSIRRRWSLHTTRSWKFAGLEEGVDTLYRSGDLLHESNYGKDIIVGLLDSGIWPESKSFSDEGLGPIPKRWKGICQAGDAFNSSHCNRKLIGARYYLKGYEQYYNQKLNTTAEFRSPRDHDGHGTHTSSTVGGRRVHGVSALGGFAQGTASGGAPLARLAMYKVCWPIPGKSLIEGDTCMEEDMLAAIDDAIGDGVDVLSISIGSQNLSNYLEDYIAIGALHAIKRNIVVACSAGNSGPALATASNLAPWIITVAASSVDRVFISPVVLGNGKKIRGQSVAPHKLQRKMYPLAYAGDVVVPSVPKDLMGQCLPGSLSPEKTKGKIVLCLRGNGTRVGKGMEVQRAGGAGIILGNSPTNGDEISVDAYVLPGTAVVSHDAITIINYIKSTKNPKALIIPPTTILDSKPAPFMAAFSSQGPNVLEPNILKPDITAPGLNILAAWSEADSPTKLDLDPRIVKYNLLSGTSMSCPHIAATAALLKAIYPSWSSAAIRSAIMTTATTKSNIGKPLTDASGKKANPFSYGSGHFRPTKAADPGLVYDASYTDYLLFLCSTGINNFDSTFKCPNVPPSPSNLNHPSLAISKLKGPMTVTRTVTNVGGSRSLYFVRVRSPPGISVEINPSVLYFSHVGEKKKFTITVKPKGKVVNGEEYKFGWYTWSDGIHEVRSPMAISLL